MSQNFFEEMREQSQVKSLIVQKYFQTWAKIMIGTQKRYNRNDEPIAYIDLFAGPGQYSNKDISTPLLILQDAINDAEIRNKLISSFND
ncbi:MAG: three-Cys-motif partner protein TcmP, partial [Chloroflexota bacterium]